MSTQRPEYTEGFVGPKPEERLPREDPVEGLNWRETAVSDATRWLEKNGISDPAVRDRVIARILSKRYFEGQKVASTDLKSLDNPRLGFDIYAQVMLDLPGIARTEFNAVTTDAWEASWGDVTGAIAALKLGVSNFEQALHDASIGWLEDHKDFYLQQYLKAYQGSLQDRQPPPSAATFLKQNKDTIIGTAFWASGAFTSLDVVQPAALAKTFLENRERRDKAAGDLRDYIKTRYTDRLQSKMKAEGTKVGSPAWQALDDRVADIQKYSGSLVDAFVAPGGGFDRGAAPRDWVKLYAPDLDAEVGALLGSVEEGENQADYQKKRSKFIAEKQSGLTPEQQDILGDLDLGGIFDQADGNEKVANNILKGYTDAADAQLQQGKTFKDLLGPVDASGKPTGESLFGNVDPALREALGKGLPLWGQGVFGSLVKGSPLYESAFGQDEEAGNAFISGVYGSNAEFGPTFDATGKLISGTLKGNPSAALSEAQKRLIQQARDQGRGGDASVLQAVYGIRTSTVDPVTKQASNVPPTSDAAIEAAIARAVAAGDRDGEQSLRSRLPGFKTRAEQMAGSGGLPTGTGKGISRYYETRGLTGEALRQASEKYRLEDEEEARQAQLKRNPPPRQRLK